MRKYENLEEKKILNMKMLKNALVKKQKDGNLGLNGLVNLKNVQFLPYFIIKQKCLLLKINVGGLRQWCPHSNLWPCAYSGDTQLLLGLLSQNPP